MDLLYVIKVANCDVSEDTLRDVANKIFDAGYETFSPARYHPGSEVAKIGALSVGETLKVSSEMDVVLRCVVHMNRITDGLFDPSCETALLHWEKTGSAPPSSDTWSTTFSYSPHTKTLTKKSDGSIDLSGIAKGHIVDLLLKAVQNHLGKGSIYVEWGGEVRVAGEREWEIDVVDPGVGGKPAAVLTEKNASVATSGDYGAKLGKSENLTHIYDTITKSPVCFAESGSGRAASVSVVAPSCMHADALATALLCKTPENIIAAMNRNLGSSLSVSEVVIVVRGSKGCECLKWNATPTTAIPAKREEATVRSLTASIPHMVHILTFQFETKRVSVAADSVVVVKGVVLFNAAKGNILADFVKTAPCVLKIIPLEGNTSNRSALHTLARNVEWTLPEDILQHAMTVSITHTVEAGDHVVAVGRGEGVVAPRRTTLATASLPHGRYYGVCASGNSVGPLCLARSGVKWCVATDFNSLSASPRLVQFCCAAGVFAEGIEVVVEVLSARDCAVVLGGGGDGGVPLVSRAGGAAVCTVRAVVPAGDEVFVVAAVRSLTVPPSREAVSYAMVERGDGVCRPVSFAPLPEARPSVVASQPDACGSPTNAIRRARQPVPESARNTPAWQCA